MGTSSCEPSINSCSLWLNDCEVSVQLSTWDAFRAGVTPGQVWNETGGMPVCSSRSRTGVTEPCISVASDICVWELKYTWKWDSACTLKYVSPHELDICVPTSASGEQIHTDGRHWRTIPLIPCRDLLRACQALFEVSINWFSDQDGNQGSCIQTMCSLLKSAFESPKGGRTYHISGAFDQMSVWSQEGFLLHCNVYVWFSFFGCLSI